MACHLALPRSGRGIQSFITQWASLLHSRQFAGATAAAAVAGEASTAGPASPAAAATTAERAGPPDAAPSGLGTSGRSFAAAAAGQRPEPVSYPLRLTGLSQTTMRRDVVRLFAGFNINEYNVKPEYDQRTLYPKAFWVLFSTEKEREGALSLNKHYIGPHQVYMRPVDGGRYMHQVLLCPLAMRSRGRYLLLDNVEGTNSLTTVIRHFEGFLLAPHAATLVMDDPGKRPTNEYEATSPKTREELVDRKPSIRAVVRFMTIEEAHRALRARNNTYLGNDLVSLRVLP